MAKKQQVMKKLSLADAVSEAWGELEGLGQEMREWADNLEEKFSSTDKYARVSEAADTLEGESEPTVPESLADVQVEFMDLPPRKRGYSRADRCGQACYILDQCVNELETKADVLKEGDVFDECQSLIDDCQTLKDNCEGVEFPGMYG